MLRISSNIREVEVDIERVERQISDFTPLWDILIDRVLVNWFDQAFDTEGFGNWSERKDDLPHPLLQLTGALRRSLTQPGSEENINVQRPDSLDYGSDLFYHIYHEQGTSRMDARAIIGEVLRQPQFESDVEREVEDYFQNVIDGRIV